MLSLSEILINKPLAPRWRTMLGDMEKSDGNNSHKYHVEMVRLFLILRPISPDYSFRTVFIFKTDSFLPWVMLFLISSGLPWVIPLVSNQFITESKLLVDFSGLESRRRMVGPVISSREEAVSLSFLVKSRHFEVISSWLDFSWFT